MKTKMITFTLIIFIVKTSLAINPAISKNLPSNMRKITSTFDNKPQYKPGQIIVKFKQQVGSFNLSKDGSPTTGVSSLDEQMAAYGIRSMTKTFKHKPIPNNSIIADISRIYTLYFDENRAVREIAKVFSSDPNVEYAEPVPIYYIEETPNDPQYNLQEHLPQTHMPEAWDIVKGDSNIVIAIVDNGTDYNHSDLAANVWTNNLEAMGLPGVDDDNNGYKDDVHGWDFADNDNNPINTPQDNEGYWMHGTHTAGLAAAVTNNNMNVAGVSWNCEFMPVKVSYDNTPKSVDFGYQGIIYAADNGAHIISLSWGGFFEYFQAGQDVINYAYHKGCTIIAAAGNEKTNAFHYPAAFDHVCGVTWVDANDILSSLSPYGIAVDICAPGVNLLSLRPGGGVVWMSGSSMAAPVAAGIAGLIKSQHPEWSPFQVTRQMALTANNIDHLNPDVAGQIGSGRVNGYRAVSETNPAEIPPRIKPLNVSFSDLTGGDNDHIFERGETIEVVASYHNFSVSPGINVVFTLTCDDTDLTLINGTLDYGYFPPDTIVSMLIPFTFTVNNNARGKTAKIFVGWQAEGGFSGADTFKVIIGKIPILIVDDDFDDSQGNDYFPESEKMYTNILDMFQLNYALWDRRMMGPLGPDQLTNFPVVIWLCGWAFPSLNSDDQTAIANFLDHGGSLFLTGQDIGWDFNDPEGYGYQQRDFYAKYLHAVYYADDSPINDVVGIPGDPIGNGLEFKAWQPGLPADYQYPDEIESTADASAVFEYVGGKNHKFGIKYEGDYKVVYFGMGLEAIDSKQDTPPDDISPIRTEVMSRVLNFLNFIDFKPISGTENLTEPRTINARVTNSFAEADLVRIELYWRKKGEAQFASVSMSSIGNGQYRAEIPAPGADTEIQYYMKMINTYYDWTSPQQAPNYFYSYYVGPDTVQPTFSHVPLKSIINGEEARSLLVAVNDNVKLDTTKVYVHYTSKSLSDSVRLIATENPELFQVNLSPVFAYGDTVWYYFTAYDKARIPNRGQSESYSFVVGYEDFESELYSWDTLPEGWGLEDLFAHSGKYSINDSPNQSPYPNNRNVSITTNFGFDLSQAEHATLKFWTKVYLEINHDYGYVEVSNDGGLSWHQVGSAFNGFITSWKQQTISLDDYCGAGNTNVRIRFRMVSDATQIPPVPGWFIDDVQIIEGRKVTKITEDGNTNLPTQYTLYQNYPNPFNSETKIRFDLPVAGNVTLKIFNIRGEQVRTLVQEQMIAGSYWSQWDGRDERGQVLSSGIYFYKLSTNNFTATQKLLLLK